MPISASRVLALQNRKHNIIGGFHKTIHLEKVTSVAGTSDFRPGRSTTTSSILIQPPPVVRIVSEEDISEAGENVSLSDLLFEIPGDAVLESDLRAANQLCLNKDQDDEEFMQILQIRPAMWIRATGAERELAVVGGQVQRWNIFARATRKAI